MKIHSLKLKNYRQYRNAEIFFCTDSKKNFNIILGSNGSGKSNLLNAVTWCLYGEERHLSKSAEGLPIINEKVYYNLTKGDTEELKVEIALGEDQIQYIIKRCAKAFKREDGEISLIMDDNPTIMYLIRGNWRASEQPNYSINVLLPAEISHFFFFDGEQLDKFFQEDSAKQIRNGMVKVSQTNLLDMAEEHIEKVGTEIRKKAKGITPEIDNLRHEIDILEEERDKSREKLKQFGRDKNAIQENLNQIDGKLKSSSIELVKNLQKERELIEYEIDDQESRLDRLKENSSNLLIKLGPKIYSYEALNYSLARIMKEVERGKLPPKVRKLFFLDLLKEGTCVCGQQLTEGSEFRKMVMEKMNAIENTEYKDAHDGKFSINHIINNIFDLRDRLKEINKDIWETEEKIGSSKEKLKEISQKIEKSGIELEAEEISFLEQQRGNYIQEMEEINKKIGETSYMLSITEKSINQKKTELDRALEKNKQQKELLSKLRLCDQAQVTLKEIRKELIAEIRRHIEQKTNEYFLRLIWKKETYKGVYIDENYKVNVLNIRNLPSLGTLSAGERQILALSFMAALATISGFDAPIVIDTPIGRISGEPRDNIAESLPNYLENSQITLLVTDTEYTDSFRKRIFARTGMEFLLDFNEENGETKVIKYENRSTA